MDAPPRAPTPPSPSPPPEAPGDADGAFPRVRTGNPQADHILGGGFPGHSINVIMGQPGSGKTVFVEQMLFHNAAEAVAAGDDRPVLYLTTLSEPLAKVVSYLQRFRFFDPGLLGTAVVYEDVGAELGRGGVDVLVPRVRELITTLSPRLIVIDSFKALHDLEPSAVKMRCAISDLAGLLTAYDVTTFLVGEYAEENNSRYPEFAVADGIVELARKPLSTRDERYFRVFKLRGSAYREGYHGMRINESGVDIFPRLVSPSAPERYHIHLDRTPSGTPGLDALLGGGLWRGSTTLVAGPTGSGKTTLGVQFALEGPRVGEPSLYVNFQESPAQMHRVVRALGKADRPDASLPEGFHLMHRSPVELQIDSILVELFRTAEELGIRRVVIDALGELYASAADSARLHDYLYALIQHFTTRGVTSLLTFETTGISGLASAQDVRFSYITDNIVVLDTVLERDRTRRTARALKTRNSPHDPMVRELVFGPDGASLTTA